MVTPFTILRAAATHSNWISIMVSEYEQELKGGVDAWFDDFFDRKLTLPSIFGLSTLSEQMMAEGSVKTIDTSRGLEW